MNILSRVREALNPEDRRIIGAEAQQLLDNRHFREAFEAVSEYLNDQARGCDPDNKEKAQRVILSMQLLEAIRREIVRKVEDGEMAQIEIASIERAKRPMRFVR